MKKFENIGKITRNSETMSKTVKKLNVTKILNN